VLLVTVDTFTIAWRPTDLDAGYLPFITTNEGNAIGFSDPVFRKKLAEGEPGGEGEEEDGKSEPVTPENNALAASLRWTSEVFPRRARPWSDLATLRRIWGDDGAILIKGVQHPDDALLARQYGADGVVVSNHGGRQVDGAVGSLEMLPEVVASVRAAEARDTGEAERNGTGAQQPAPFTILFDSGIRTGSDVIKALCLGAQAVLVGRPVMYGLGIAGREGAKHVLRGLLADLDQTMNLIGCASIADLGPHMLRKGGAAFKALL
jgi:lactate 2-monooxygenase